MLASGPVDTAPWHPVASVRHTTADTASHPDHASPKMKRPMPMSPAQTVPVGLEEFGEEVCNARHRGADLQMAVAIFRRVVLETTPLRSMLSPTWDTTAATVMRQRCGTPDSRPAFGRETRVSNIDAL